MWRKGWRPIILQRLGRKHRFVMVYRGKKLRIRITRRGVKIFKGKRWKGIAIRRPHRRSRKRLIRKMRRRSRKVIRRIINRIKSIKKRRRRKRRRRRQPITGKKLRRPRVIRCGMRVRFFRKFRPVIRYKKHFFVRYHKRRVRISFRKTVFRIYYKGKWRRRKSYRRIRVRINKKYRYIKKTTRKGVKTWITRCYGRRRPIRFRGGRRIIKTTTTWTRVTRHVIMRARIKGRIYPVFRRHRQWYLKDKKKFRLMYLRGRALLLRIKKKWKKLTGNPLQVRYKRSWRTISNCCKKLRLRIRGRSRLISLKRGGLKVQFKGRRIGLGQMGRLIRHARRRMNKRQKRRRRVVPRRRRKRNFRLRQIRRRRRVGGRRRRKRLFGKRTSIPKSKF